MGVFCMQCTDAWHGDFNYSFSKTKRCSEIAQLLFIVDGKCRWENVFSYSLVFQAMPEKEAKIGFGKWSESLVSRGSQLCNFLLFIFLCSSYRCGSSVRFYLEYTLYMKLHTYVTQFFVWCHLWNWSWIY